MEHSIFRDEQILPDEQKLKKVLGKSHDLLKDILKHISVNYGSIVFEWKFYSKTSGWTRKNLLGKRNLFFFTPMNNKFRVTFIFGEKAIEKIMKSRLPEKFKQELLATKRYAEGRGISLFVKKKSDVELILKLVEIKMYN